MFLGYSLMWGMIVLYVGNLQRRQAAVQREVSALRAVLEDGGIAPEVQAAGPATAAVTHPLR